MIKSSNARQWTKRFRGQDISCEIFFDPYQQEVVLLEEGREGTITTIQPTEQLISAVYAYDRILENYFVIHPGLVQQEPPGTDVAATRRLWAFMDREVDDWEPAKAVARVKQLIQEGADVNLSAYATGMGVLSAVRNSLELTRLFVINGAATDVIEKRLRWDCTTGATPLHKAILSQEEPIVNYLRSCTNDLDFHLRIAVQLAHLHFERNADMAAGWNFTQRQYKKTWHRVITLLLEWGAIPPVDYPALEQLANAAMFPYEKNILALKDTSTHGWADKTDDAIRQLSTAQLDRLIKNVLSLPEVIRHPSWAALISTILDVQRSFEDVAEETYGFRVSLENDEGSLCQGWHHGNYSNYLALLKMLQQTDAMKDPQWPVLVSRIIDVCEVADCSVYMLEEFLRKKTVRLHPAAHTLMEQLKRYL